MKKIIKGILLLLVIMVIAILSYVKLALPNVGEIEYLSIKPTASRLERGKYLATHVCVCVDCHSTRNWNEFSGPLVDGTLGKGGEVFDQRFGFPGSFYAKNITPSGIGNWTDGEILRAIASGVSKNGKALFPIMPHPHFGKMDKEDLESIIVYVRTLKPIQNIVPESKPDFPMNFIINTIPEKPHFSTMPNESDAVAYGSYLFNAASCAVCHSKQEKGKPIEGMELAGGFEFPMVTGGISRSANITQDEITGIGKWSEVDFVKRFKTYSDSTYVPNKILKGNFNTVMPWTMYAGMSEQDLKAIYAYLKTIKPIKNSVEKFTNP
ncbi:cytochrome c [Flavobacterium granuli]|uniref:Mono/diheme cytochrome c family protein n=1 Tax=Flavobacterium granuli TaxID=280093 RepID=A0ABU1RY14_9FLAO|nr:cytochrome c [Flavobacterium granuli]MDR6843654.1 mono/diheme cytochrome c family protein [Flavobacterium granuli]